MILNVFIQSNIGQKTCYLLHLWCNINVLSVYLLIFDENCVNRVSVQKIEFYNNGIDGGKNNV